MKVTEKLKGHATSASRTSLDPLSPLQCTAFEKQGAKEEVWRRGGEWWAGASPGALRTSSFAPPLSSIQRKYTELEEEELERVFMLWSSKGEGGQVRRWAQVWRAAVTSLGGI